MYSLNADKNLPILRLESISKHFSIESNRLFGQQISLKAVHDVSIEINEGEILGVVGESGCGKSTLGRIMLRLLKPTSGNIWYRDRDITFMDEKSLRPYRRKLQMVFQDPFASLNPRMTVEEIIMDAMEVQNLYGDVKGRRTKCQELMQECGLSEEFSRRYPHEFSGGQRQRIGIARALSVDPELVICDEPVSALDVSIQAQIINLLSEMKISRKLTLVFISHDLSVVNHIADRVAVMYLGRIVELANTDELFGNPKHPYTKALLDSIPKIDSGKFDLNKDILEGNIPSPVHLPPGCVFQSRCRLCSNECRVDGVVKLSNIGHDHFCECIKAL